MIRFEGRCPYLLIDRAGPTLSRNVCIFILCEYMCIGAESSRARMHVWRSEGILQELVLCLQLPEIQLQLVGLEAAIFTLSHFSSPHFIYFLNLEYLDYKSESQETTTWGSLP